MQIKSFLSEINSTYKNIVSIETIGKTYEDREIQLIKICKNNRCGQNPGIWIDGGYLIKVIKLSVRGFLILKSQGGITLLKPRPDEERLNRGENLSIPMTI